MPEIKEELVIFLLAVISGMVVRLVYRCLGCLRHIVRHSPAAVGIEDIFYWIGCALYVFVQIYHTSDGSIRWNFILGIVVGVAFITIFFKKIENMHKKIYIYKEDKLSENVAEKRKKRYYK